MVVRLFFLFFLFTFGFAVNPTRHPSIDPLSLKDCPDCNRNVSELISTKGYPVENHWVTTEDGYILSLIRIPHGIKTKASKGVIFLQHGLLDSCTTWVILEAHQSLGFILADAGYDVWLGNSRGNTYSNKAINMTIKDKAFWAFSFDEMAKYDLPAMLNYAMKVSNVPDVIYMGHSQGSAEAFSGFSLDKELASKIRLFVGLGPAAFVEHASSSLIRIMAYLRADFLFQLFGFTEFLPKSPIFEYFGLQCEKLPIVCDNFLFLIVGWGNQTFNNTRLPVMISHTPAGTSVQNMIHWAQAVRTGNFQMYDFGTEENKKRYHQPTPPHYDLSVLKMPVALFYGSDDALTTPTDVRHLQKQLSNVVMSEELAGYNHLDYVWRQDAHQYFYPSLLNLLSKY